jgi:hypothetical protein
VAAELIGTAFLVAAAAGSGIAAQVETGALIVAQMSALGRVCWVASPRRFMIGPVRRERGRRRDG